MCKDECADFGITVIIVIIVITVIAPVQGPAEQRQRHGSNSSELEVQLVPFVMQ